MQESTYYVMRSHRPRNLALARECVSSCWVAGEGTVRRVGEGARSGMAVNRSGEEVGGVLSTLCSIGKGSVSCTKGPLLSMPLSVGLLPFSRQLSVE